MHKCQKTDENIKNSELLNDQLLSFTVASFKKKNFSKAQQKKNTVLVKKSVMLIDYGNLVCE